MVFAERTRLMKIKVDYLIIGQGLAGTIISQKLLEANHSIHVIENFKANSASRIAAGVYNPVTYRKLKMAEYANFLIPEVELFYPKLEKLLNAHFYTSSSFLKILTDIEELNNWQIQSAISKNAPFMSKEIFTSDFENSIENKIGAGQVLQSGVVNTTPLLDAYKSYLKLSDQISEEQFDYSQLIISDSLIEYKKITAKNIIFCEGVGISENPWFNWLPIQKFKGEVLEIEAPTLSLTRMVNRGVFVLPMGNARFKVGATHDWKKVDEIPTQKGKLELTEKLDNIINVPYRIVSHSAGLRPATRDRHPYIGSHPIHKNMFVFNGLGSKGVIMAPWLANCFINGIPTLDWPKEFNLNRFIRFYTEISTHEKN